MESAVAIQETVGVDDGVIHLNYLRYSGLFRHVGFSSIVVETGIAASPKRVKR